MGVFTFVTHKRHKKRMMASGSERCVYCHAQQQQSARLSRCSRCKWVAYCCKTCQGAHWKSSHRAMCGALQVCGKFRALEASWWRAQPEHELHVLVAQHGLEPESMVFNHAVLLLSLLYGDGFVALGTNDDDTCDAACCCSVSLAKCSSC